MPDIDIQQLLAPQNSFAIIGASVDPQKKGYQIYQQLKSMGYRVFAVNNNHTNIGNDRTYSKIQDLPVKVDVLNFVIPPQFSSIITTEALNLGYKVFWYQPGSFTTEVLNLHKGKGTTVISNICLLKSTKIISTNYPQLEDLVV